MIPFNEKYAKMHAKIQEDDDLVRKIYKMARKKGLRGKKYIDNEDGVSGPTDLYFSCGMVGKIYLGLDLNFTHVMLRTHTIISNMRIIYEATDGDADLSRVFAVLDDELGIITEDMTYGGKCRIQDITNELNPILFRLYEPGFGDINHTTFEVHGPRPMRTPIVDLDHLSPKREYYKTFLKYSSEYEKGHESFRVQEV